MYASLSQNVNWKVKERINHKIIIKINSMFELCIQYHNI